MNIKRIALQNTKPSDKSVLWLKPEGDKLAVAVFDGKWRYLDVKDTDAKVAQIEEALNDLIGVDDTTAVIDTFNEVKNLLADMDNTSQLYTKSEVDSTFLTKTVFDTKEEVISEALNQLNETIGDINTILSGI